MEDPTSATDTAPPQFAFKKRNAKSQSALRKRPATPPPTTSDHASDSDSGFSSFEDESGRKIKRRKRNTGVLTTSSTTQSTSRPTNLPSDDPSSNVKAAAIPSAKDDATKSSHWYDDDPPRSSSSSTSRKPLQSTTNTTTTSSLTGPSKTVGPTKSSSNVRVVTTTDFAPDVCKDYKQTGFCGFGDSCKFLHAREDYKQGWALDREWEIVGPGGKGAAGGEKKKKSAAAAAAAGGVKNGTGGARGGADVGGGNEDEEAQLEKIPFACVICKGPYKDPVVTRCGHYFCEACALGRYKRDPSCAVCGSGTGGVFNGARKLAGLLERKRRREEEMGKGEGGEE